MYTRPGIELVKDYIVTDKFKRLVAVGRYLLDFGHGMTPVIPMVLAYVLNDRHGNLYVLSNLGLLNLM
jgi:uncharacterized membrane protein